MRKYETILTFLAILGLGVFPVGCLAASQNFGEAPDFTLTSIEGEEVSLSDSEGKVRIVDFWATWCPPCREGIPEFVELYEQYRDQGLEVIGISLDQGGEQIVKPFAKKMKMNYPVLLADDKVAKDFGGVRAIPTAFVINRKGEIVKKFVGYQPKQVFEKAILPLLKE